MSKEQLEDIRKLLVNLYNAVDVDEEMKRYIFNGLKIEWLVERAEQAQSLEHYKKDWMLVVEQNKRLRETLNSVVALWASSTDAIDDTWLAHKMSEVARKALEGEFNE